MATDDQRERAEQQLVVRNEIMQQIQRGEPFTRIEAATADELGIRVPAYLRPGGAGDVVADEEIPGVGGDSGAAQPPQLAAPLPPPDGDDELPLLADMTGEEWLTEFYNALAELWANAGWLPFALGQLGAAVQGGVEAELVDRMFAQAADDVAGIGNATRRLLEVTQQGLINLQARRTPDQG